MSARKRHPGLPNLKRIALVDTFLYLLDARIPRTSLQIVQPFLLKKSRIYVLTKPDLAQSRITSSWVRKFKTQGWPCFAVECNTGRGVRGLIDFLDEKQVAKQHETSSKVVASPLRVMLFGLPNVGKSSLANRLLGTSRASFGAKPGLTRGSHWLRRGMLEILDTPGVIDSSQAKGETLYKLAATWAVPDNHYDSEEVAFWLAKHVLKKEHPVSYITEFGQNRGFLIKGGTVDFTRASNAFIQDFRYGKLGQFSIEKPYE